MEPEELRFYGHAFTPPSSRFILRNTIYSGRANMNQILLYTLGQKENKSLNIKRRPLETGLKSSLISYLLETSPL